MTYFESIGVDHQYRANSIKKANKELEHSCDVCCTQGKYIACDRCAIAFAHNLVVACFKK